MRGYPDGQLAKNLVFFGAKIGVPLPFEPKRTLSTFLHGILFGQFLPDEFTDVAAENIDLTAKLLLNDDSMRWLVANCHALRANVGSYGSSRGDNERSKSRV